MARGMGHAEAAKHAGISQWQARNLYYSYLSHGRNLAEMIAIGEFDGHLERDLKYFAAVVNALPKARAFFSEFYAQ